MKIGDTLPTGCYVHGRSGSQELSQRWIIQATEDWDTAAAYAGQQGSVWTIQLLPTTTIIDMTRKVVITMIADRLRSDWERGTLDESIRSILDALEYDGVEDPAMHLAREYNPTSIVDSAGAHDNHELACWLYDAYQLDAAVTYDGLVVYNRDAVEVKKIEK